jgi:uncharacterized membrane protein YbhN (UPF0104 family)
LADDVLIGLGATLPLIVLLAALLRYGSVFQRLERLAVRLLGEHAGSFLAGQSVDLDAAIRELCGDWPRLGTTLAWQVTGMVAGSLETWLALRWLGHPVHFGAAIAIDSLTMTVRNFAFLVPAGLGVQEASLVAFGALLGVHGELALALSLVKRMREILFGAPALLSWYWMEGRRELQHVRGSGKY